MTRRRTPGTVARWSRTPRSGGGSSRLEQAHAPSELVHDERRAAGRLCLHHASISRSCSPAASTRRRRSSAAKLGDDGGGRAAPTGLDRCKAPLQRLVQASHLVLAHPILRLHQPELDLAVGELFAGLAITGAPQLVHAAQLPDVRGQHPVLHEGTIRLERWSGNQENACVTNDTGIDLGINARGAGYHCGSSQCSAGNVDADGVGLLWGGERRAPKLVHDRATLARSRYVNPSRS